MTCQYTLLPQRGVLQVSGADARVFLQGLLTNNLERLTPGQALYAALLTPPGRFLFDMLLVERQDGALLLEAEGERLPELITTLQRWKLRARVEITDVSADWQAVVIFGAEALPGLELPATPGALRPWGEAAAGYVYVDPRLAALGARALLPAATAEGALAAAGCTAAEFAAYDRHRIQLAVPDGSRDMPVDKAIILEYGLDRLNGIDFYKGCYLGQELIARTHFRGQVRKTLECIRLADYFTDSSPATGAELIRNGQKAGRLCSFQGETGLALMRVGVPED